MTLEAGMRVCVRVRVWACARVCVRACVDVCVCACAALHNQRQGPHSLVTVRRGLPARTDNARSWMAHPPIPHNFFT